MGVGRPHPNSLANLRPPFQKGNTVGKHNNPWLSRANEIREDLWKAATPEARAALAKQTWEFALGRAEEPVLDEDGVPMVNPDGSWKVGPLPPERRATMQRWGTDTILNVLGGSFSMKSIEANLTVSETTPDDEALEAARVLIDMGGPFADLVPQRMKELASGANTDA